MIRKRILAMVAGACTGATTGVGVGASAAEYVLVVDPTGVSALLAIGGCGFVGAVGGALGITALVGASEEGDKDGGN